MKIFSKIFFVVCLSISFEAFATITIRYSEDGAPEKKFEFPNNNGDVTVIVNARGVAGWREFGLNWINFSNNSLLANSLTDYLEVRKYFAPDVKSEEFTINLELGRAVNPYDYELKPSDGTNTKFVINGLDVGGDFSKEELAKYSAKREVFRLAGNTIEAREGLPMTYFAEITHQFAGALGRHLANHHAVLPVEDIQKLAEKYFSFDVEFGKTYFTAADICRKMIQKEFAEFMGVFVMHKSAQIERYRNNAMREYYGKLFPVFDAVARFNSDRAEARDSERLIKEYLRRAESPLELLAVNLAGGKVDGFFSYKDLQNLSRLSDNPAEKQKYERAKLALLASLNGNRISEELPKIFMYGDSYSTYSCNGVYFRKNLR